MKKPKKLLQLVSVNVLVLCVSLILLELVLRATGYGSPATRPDPFFDFPGTNSLFQIQYPRGQSPRYILAPNKRNDFKVNVTFPVDKPANVYRIFALGGSTTEGLPYGNSDSFPFWLEKELRRQILSL